MADGYGKLALAAAVALTLCPAAGSPASAGSEIAPRSAATADVVRERRQAAEARRQAIRPDADAKGGIDTPRLWEAMRLLEAAERVEGIKALRRGPSAADGDVVGRLNRPSRPAPDSTNESLDAWD